MSTVLGWWDGTDCKLQPCGVHNIRIGRESDDGERLLEWTESGLPTSIRSRMFIPYILPRIKSRARTSWPVGNGKRGIRSPPNGLTDYQLSIHQRASDWTLKMPIQNLRHYLKLGQCIQAQPMIDVSPFLWWRWSPLYYNPGRARQSDSVVLKLCRSVPRSRLWLFARQTYLLFKI